MDVHDPSVRVAVATTGHVPAASSVDEVTELWTVAEAAAHWGVSLGRARQILSRRKIRRVSGYPAEEIKAVELRQGARTDLSTD